MKREINNSQDVMDSRDIIARIDELESMVNDNNDLPDDEREDLSEEETELAALKALADEADGSPDWPYGEVLIRESYWVDYVKELLEDTGDLPKDLPWYIEIDWDTTANNIAVDYSQVDFDGVTYYIRL